MQKYNENNPMLVNSMVCTIDILFFTNDNKYGNNLIKGINSLINRNKQCIIKNKYSKGKIKIYTDNMIVGYPIKGLLKLN